MPGKRKVFTETWEGSGSTRKVLRTYVEHYFGIDDIVSALADRYYEFERAEDMLSVGRRSAERLFKAAVHDRGITLSEIGIEEIVEGFGVELTLEGKPAPIPAFIGALRLHVKKLFPELVE